MLPAVVTADDTDLPAKCFRADDQGNLPSCTSSDGTHWTVSYPDDSSGIPAGFVVALVLVLLLGVAGTVWMVSRSRAMARRAGLDPDDAAAVTLLSDHGFEATYLASSLGRDRAPRADAADRLRAVEALREQGLLSEEEYADRRRAVLDDL